MFCRNNWLFLSAVYKNNLKIEFKELRVRDKHTSNLYWFTFTPRVTSSPQKPLGIPLCNQNQITNTTHQSSDLEPLKKHTTFGQHTNTKNADLDPLKNTQHFSANTQTNLFNRIQGLHLLQKKIWNQYKQKSHLTLFDQSQSLSNLNSLKNRNLLFSKDCCS